jgi:HEAT repeat protein
MGPEGKPAINLLIEALTDHSAKAIWNHDPVYAAMALGRIGQHAARAVPVLTDALHHELPSVREEAALSLGLIGTAAKMALPELRKTLQDKEPSVRARAALAVWLVGQSTRDSLPVMIETLRAYVRPGPGSTDSGIIKRIIEALGEIGPNAREADPVLIPLLKDTKWSIRRAAAEALKNIDPTAEQKEGAP